MFSLGVIHASLFLLIQIKKNYYSTYASQFPLGKSCQICLYKFKLNSSLLFSNDTHFVQSELYLQSMNFLKHQCQSVHSRAKICFVTFSVSEALQKMIYCSAFRILCTAFKCALLILYSYILVQKNISQFAPRLYSQHIRYLSQGCLGVLAVYHLQV